MITIRGLEDIGPAPVPGQLTADRVAATVMAAITAACAETGAVPRHVARGDVDSRLDRTFAISRARTYAALALRAIFDDMSAPNISRMVGSKYPDGYLGQIDSRMKNNDLKWFDNDAFMRVVAATEESV